MTEDTHAPETGNATEPGFPPGIAAAMVGRLFGGANRAPYLGSFDGDAIDALKKLALEASEPKVLSVPTTGLEPGLPPQVPIMWDRETQQPISLIDVLEEARPKQVRKGTAKVLTLASFIDLTNRHKDAGSVIFAATNWPDPRLTAVIDYHTAEREARWGKHRVEYPFPITAEFKTWIDGNGKEMPQEIFGAFLEEHAAELAAPFTAEIDEYERLFKERFATPAELIDLSRSLEINVGATVKNAARPQSGERQIIFTTEHTGPNGEAVDIPGIFMVSVAPFAAGDGAAEVVRFVARIRYRIKGGIITWFFQLYRWEQVLRDRIQQDLARAAKETGLPFFEGAPEMPA